MRAAMTAIAAAALVACGCGGSTGSSRPSVAQVNAAMTDFNTSIQAYLSIRGPGSATDAATWQAWESAAAAKVNEMASRFSTWSDLLDRSGRASGSMAQYRDAMRTEVNDQVEQAHLAAGCLATGISPTASQCFTSMLNANYARWTADAAAVNAYLKNPPQGSSVGGG